MRRGWPACPGITPRWAGYHPRTQLITFRERLIPAHAGKTTTPFPRSRSCWAHPRSRGENFGDFGCGTAFSGSSPLMRGKRNGAAAAVGTAGLIPAHAGKTTAASSGRHRSRAHPRSRGENSRSSRTFVSWLDSSPLTRGKPCGEGTPCVPEGFIPTHAGKTTNRGARATGTRAHPHSRGENRFLARELLGQSGSSPPTRGKPPAPSPTGRDGGAHPRSRGENYDLMRGRVGDGGSSPLTRGKHTFEYYTGPRERLIPAHAGKTPPLSNRRNQNRAHPRSRGENLYE